MTVPSWLFALSATVMLSCLGSLWYLAWILSRLETQMVDAVERLKGLEKFEREAREELAEARGREDSQRR